MLVSNLQKFIHLLVPPLTAAGINQSAEKNITASLESLASALEPFKDLSADQLAELLVMAKEYRATGELPDWVLDKKKAPAKPRAPKAPKVPKLTTAEAVSKLRSLQERSSHLDPAQIAQEVQSLSGLSMNELKDVQRDFLGVTIGKKKDELLAALQKKIDDFRESRDRVDGILAF
jgi:hypothetical protein